MSEKKKIGGVVALIAVMVVALIAVSVYLASGMTAEEAQQFGDKAKVFVTERVVPVALGILAGVGVMLAMLAPVIAKIGVSADKFKTATDSMAGAENQTVQAASSINQYKEETRQNITTALSQMRDQNRKEIDEIRAEVVDACAQIAGVTGNVAEVLEKVGRMSEAMAIEAAADPALVAAGKAREVVEIVKGGGEPRE